jgi:hypothetical protein
MMYCGCQPFYSRLDSGFSGGLGYWGGMQKSGLSRTAGNPS